MTLTRCPSAVCAVLFLLKAPARLPPLDKPLTDITNHVHGDDDDDPWGPATSGTRGRHADADDNMYAGDMFSDEESQGSLVSHSCDSGEA